MLKHRKLALAVVIIILMCATTLQATPASQTQSGVGVFALDRISGKSLFSQNADNPLAPASTTKLMTAILIAQKGKLSDTVTVGDEVKGVEGSTLGLSPGDQITVENLLNALLIHSSNEAATALAVYADGSVEKFVAEMNTRAHELGLSTTHFVNPNGLPAPEHVSTAKEMATIAKNALDYPVIQSIVSTKLKDVSWKHEGKTKTVTLENTNKFLGVYPGVKGMKTGTTTEAGQCLVTFADWNCGQVILVVFNSTNRYAESDAYLDKLYTELQIDQAGKSLVEKLPISF